MSDWLIAKGKEDTLKLAYEYIVKEACNWILELRRNDKQSSYMHKRYKTESGYDIIKFILFKEHCVSTLFVELTKDRINVFAYKAGEPLQSRIEICSFGYYGGYVLPHIQYENVVNLYNEIEDRYEVEKASTDDSDFFSDLQIYELWKRLDDIFQSDEWIGNFESSR